MASRKILQLCLSFGCSLVTRFALGISAALFLSGCFFSFHKGVTDLNGSSPGGSVTVQFSSATSSGSDTVPVYSIAAVLSAPSSSTVTVDYAVTGGTAVNGVDYTLSNGTLTFPAGTTSELIAINITNEGAGFDKTISLQLSNPVNATLDVQATHVHTITYTTKIYRSVGPANTSVLACGGGDGSGCINNVGTLTISGTAATFGSALPNNIGVGDAIVYDCSGDAALGAGDCIAFISGRTDSTHYAVQDKTGATPMPYLAAGVWRIYRAYTGLVEATHGSGNENAAISAIDATLGNFDTWSNNNDLVSSNEQWNIALYGDALNKENGIYFNGWITGPSTYLRVYAPYLATEVGTSQRAEGVWDNTKARINCLDSGGSFITMQQTIPTYARFDGLQIENNNTDSGFFIQSTTSTGGAVYFTNNLIESSVAAGAMAIYCEVGTNASCIAANNIIWGAWSGGVNFGDAGSNGTYVIYNNTVVGTAGKGIWIGYAYGDPGNTVLIKNNIASGNTADYFTTPLGTAEYPTYTLSNNISSDATATGTNALVNKTVTFVNSSANDYRISPADTVALDAGLDLSGDSTYAFSTDIAGISRPQGAAWDIGASEVLASTSNKTELTSFTISNVYHTGFTATANFQGDANANNSATIYYCDATSTPNCDPLSGSNATMDRANGTTFIYYAENLANSGTDTYNIEVMASDSDGVIASPQTATATLLTVPTKIYRSVGPGDTSVLACGGGDGSGCYGPEGNLTIIGTTATFASALPLNIGVGDALIYDCNTNGAIGSGDCIAFIDGRTSSTQYSIQSSVGTTPSFGYGPGTVWRIYRAYTSLQDAEITALNTENSAILAIAGSFFAFDTNYYWDSDMTALNLQWNIALYGDAADTTGYNSYGWNSSPDNYIRVYAPYLSSEVGISQRHNGSWSNNAARIVKTGCASADMLSADYAGYLRFDGIELGLTGNCVSGGEVDAVRFQPSGGDLYQNLHSDNRVTNMLMNIVNTGAGVAGGILTWGGHVTIANNIIYGSNSRGITSNTSGAGITYVYNNTFAGMSEGVQADSSGSKWYFKNNIATGNSSGDYVLYTAPDASSANNLSSDASAPGTSALINKTVSYVDPGAYDFRLSPSDNSGARDGGVDLSADANYAFNTDIDQMSRPQGTAWDIGASEAVPSTSNSTEILGLRISNITATGFTATVGFSGDANANNWAGIYYCDATVSPGCDPMTAFGSGMTRGNGAFTYTATNNVNGDALNIKILSTDPDGDSGTPLTMSLGQQIYRSVGPNNTSALASGAANAMTISSHTATFASAIPNNVGVGDAVVYNTNANIAFIIGRTDSTHYTLQAANGSAPAAIAGDTTWSIYRAYTSLNNADNGPGNNLENTGIPAGVRNFDPSTAAYDLPSNNTMWNIALYGDAADTSTDIWFGRWTTAQGNSLRVYTPHLQSEVGITQRHSGVWSNTVGRIVISSPTAGGYPIFSESPSGYYTVDGLELSFVGSGDGIEAYDASNNLVYYHGADSSLAAITANNDWNNIVYCSGAPTTTYGIQGSDIYNNTVSGCGINIDSGGAVYHFAKNNISVGGGQVNYNTSAGSWDSSSDYNISSSASATGGTHDKTSATVTFVNAAANDYRLSSSDTVALDAGEDLSGDANLAFATDISGTPRPQGAAWDIGASEAVTAASNGTEMLTLSFSTIYHTGFTATATFQGDANANNSATIYYCDATSTPGCDPISGASAAMTRAAGQFTYNAVNLTNSNTDTYNVTVVAADADGSYGSPLSGTVTLLAAPTTIYRSVGPGNTAALASGSANAMSISGSTATFTSGLPNNIGVGDAVVYGSSTDIAFISARIDSTHYTLQSASGAAPTAAAADTTWSIFRAYTSLSNANAITGNTGIPAAVRSFDTSRDLLTPNKQLNVALYGDAADTTQSIWFNWTTTPANYIKIYAPYLATEVGVSQRHQGVWDNSKARVIGLGTFIWSENGVSLWVDGLEFQVTSNSNWNGTVDFFGSTYPMYAWVSNNLIETTVQSGIHTEGISATGGASTDEIHIWNNIVINSGVLSYGSGINIQTPEAGAYVYNNTVINASTGISGDQPTIAKNNIVQGSSSASFNSSFGFNAASTNNLSNDASAPGANPLKNKTVTFVNASADDYLISPSDTSGAIDGGVDLSADPDLAFAADVANVSRPQGAGWDIGASESVAATSNATEMLVLTLSPIFHSGFTATATFAGDNNSNNSATIYYCDATSTPGCDPLTGSSASMTRASGQFTSTLSGLANSGSDTYNVEVVTSDGDGVSGSPLSATATLLGAPVQIYRSVGENNTSALASGTANAVTISGTAATFTTALPNNIGIGDAIVYNLNANIAFISGRIDSTHYTLQNAAGAAPAAVTGDTTWNIYRAYTSLDNAVGINNGGTENTGIPAGVRNFDTWAGGDNLVSANQVLNFDLYADAPFDVTATNGITIYNWVESPDNYINIYVPQFPTEVGVTQRHSGVWDSSKVVITATSDSNMQEWYIGGSGAYYVRLDGLQMFLPDTGAGPNAAIWFPSAPVSDSDYRVSNSIIQITKGSGGAGSNIFGIMNLGGTLKASNNIIYATGSGSDFPVGIAANVFDGTFTYQYNNTVYGCDKGIQVGSAAYFVSKNNLSCGNSTADYTGGSSGTHSNNISCDATSPDAAYASKAVSFVNASGSDYRLSPSDASGAIDGGVDLSADPNLAFNTDIAGISRPQGAGWDIGASEAMAASSNATEMLNLSFSGITPNGFTATATFAGDNNANNSATIYYCDNTASPGCSPLSGSNMAMTRASGQFTASPTGLTNPADVYNVEVVAADTDGIYGSPLSSTVTLEVAPIKIYRSIGANSSALANGAANAVTISGTTATFTTALPNNIGVGDAIVYASGAQISFISGRTDSTHYTLQSASGAAPTAASADSTWNIYRAYTSISNAIDGVNGGTENTSIPAGVRNFDTWSGGTNIVSANQQWNFAVYADGISAGACMSGWTTDSTRYIRIYTPYLATEVGVSQRHNGAWDPAKLIFNSYTGVITDISYTRIEGLEMTTADVGIGANAGICYGSSGTGTNIAIDNNLIQVQAKGFSNSGMEIEGAANATYYIYNNIIFGNGGTLTNGINGSLNASSKVYMYNNTEANLHVGLNKGLNWIAKNNIAIGNSLADYNGGAGTGSSNNISSDGSAPGAGALTGKTVTFMNSSTYDFRLSPSDTSGAIDGGADLSADSNLAFNTDNAEISRPQGAAWDIGASEIVAGTSNSTMMQTIAFSGITKSGFTATATFIGDANANNSANIYYCDNTTSANCNPVTSGTSAAMVRAAGQFTYSAAGLVNPGDIYNVEVLASDADGISGNGINATVQLTPPTKIYRSVGPGNTSVMACGGGDGSGCSDVGSNLTIATTTATFASPIANNIGVGDAIVYDCSGDSALGAGDCVAFISGRTDNQHYSVQSASGGTPTAYGPAAVWRIYRAYTSLANAIDVTKGGTENSAIGAIDATLGNFDTWTGGADLVTPNEQWNVACYADGIDTTGVSVSGWTTNRSDLLKIYTPYLPSEVGVSQRHNGIWSDLAYRLEVTASRPITTGTSGLIIDGLQVLWTNRQNDGGAIGGDNTMPNYLTVSNTIVAAAGTPGTNSGGIYFENGHAATLNFYNNLIYGFSGPNESGIGIDDNGGTGGDIIYAYNNTLYDDWLHADGGLPVTMHAKNNIVQGSGGYVGNGFATDSDYNISADSTSSGGSHDRKNATVSFINALQRDYRLSPTDSVAKNAGTNLTADANLAFTTDIKGKARPASPTAWDIGADQSASAADNGIFLSGVTAWSTSSTGFSVKSTFIGDANANASATVYYCDQTKNAFCDPLAYSEPLTRSRTQFIGDVTGLSPVNFSPGDVLKVTVIAIDADGVSASPTSTTVTLAPLLNINSVSVTAGTTATFTVSIAQSTTANVTFDYATVDGSAIAGTHYAAASGSGTITAGQTSVSLPAITTYAAGHDKYFTVVLSNIANASAGTIVGTATLAATASPATQVYRSLGVTATSLASGAANAMTISGTTATLASALPNNIGVGDAIVYNANTEIAFISGRTDSTHYIVQGPQGAAPNAITNDTTWNIYRAYTSMEDFATGVKNSNIPGALQTMFDQSYERDLVTFGRVYNLACYADGVDSGSSGINPSVDISGWTTSPSYYLRIYTPYQSSEVGTSQRHLGYWSSGGYVLRNTSNQPDLFHMTGIENFRIEGIRFENTSTYAGNDTTFVIENNQTAGSIYVDDNLFLNDAAVSSGDQTTWISTNTNAAMKVYFYNNVVIDPTSNAQCLFTDQNGTVYAYSNTFYGCLTAIQVNNTQPYLYVTAKDNIGQPSTKGEYNGTFTTDSDYNLTGAGSTYTTGGTHDLYSKSVTFVAAASDDVRLDPTDTAATGKGEDLSADTNLAISTDVQGLLRTDPWDIGASRTSNGSGNGTTLLNMTTTSLTSGFSVSVPFSGDLNGNNAATLYYCNNTTSPGCVATAGTSVAMTRHNGYFSASVAGLVPAAYNPGDVLNINVTATDTDGTTNSPLTGTVGLYSTINISSPSVIEGNTLQFKVTLSAATNNNVTFNYASADGTANAGTDYTATSGVGTITAGSTTTTINVPTIVTNPVNAIYMTMNLSSITNAVGGVVVGTGTIGDSADGITATGLTATSGSQTAFTANLSYTGDADANASLKLYYCDNTNSPGCDPLSGTVTTMSENSPTLASVQVSNLNSPINPGDTLNLEAIITDPGGVVGSPQTATVTLLNNNAISIATLKTYNVTSSGFTAALIYSGDANSNATVALTYCDETVAGAGCTPSTSIGSMTRFSPSLFMYTATGLGSPGDTLKVEATATDTDGTGNSPVQTTVALASGGNGLTLGSITTTDVQNDHFFAMVGFTGDANDNSSLTLYYCDNTKNAGCDPAVSGTAVTMVRGQTHYVGEVSNLISPNDPGDVINLKVVATDTDGVTGSPATSTVTLTSVKNIFRSIGFGNTSPLASGSSGWTLSISGNTATFNLPLPGNIGVGDIIQYDASSSGTYNSLAVISGRTSSASYVVYTSTGATPTATSSATGVWQIYRAYTSIANFSTFTENTGICGAISGLCGAALRNFDNFSSRNLTTNNEKWMAAVYNDGLDTTGGATLSKFTSTTATQYLQVFTPYASTHVGMSQRHNGSWQSLGAQFDLNGTNLDLKSNYTRIAGLLMRVEPNYCCATAILVDANFVRISQNLLWSRWPNTSGGYNSGISQGGTTGITYYVYNNILDGFSATGGTNYGSAINNGSNTVYAYNNTVANSDEGISTYQSASTRAVNNIVMSSTNSYQIDATGVWAAGSDYNVSNNTTSTGGLDDVTNASVQFNNSNFMDFRISGSDTVARGTGVSLADDANLPFVTDIAGNLRSGTWDRGAGSIMTSNPIVVSAPVFSDVQNDRFTAEVRFNGDSNKNALATLYYCNQTDSPGCSPVSTGTAVNMVRGNETFVANVEDLVSPNDPGDLLNVRVTVTDPDGVTQTAAAATVQLSNVTNIFRSVGPGSISPLASGGSNSLTITGNVATFASSLANNIGVGDVIQYDSTASGTYNTLAVISGRNSATSYIVLTAAGATPTAVPSTQTWQIYRAYTSLNNAATFSENTGICGAISGSCGANLRNFDAFTSRAMSTNNEKWNLALYADAEDSVTASITFNKFTSPTSTQYLRVFTPTAATHVGISQRHNGSWNSGGYYISDFGSVCNAFLPSSNYMRLEGLRIDVDNNACFAIYMNANYSRYDNNIIDSVGGGINALSNYGTAAPYFIYNNVIMNFSGTGMGGVNTPGATSYIFNNTFVNDYYAIGSDANQDILLLNNLVQDETQAYNVDYYSDDFLTSGFNLASRAGLSESKTDISNVANIEFLNPTAYDFQLSGYDTQARGKGFDGNIDFYPYLATDISGQPRDGSVDIGASQAVDPHSNSIIVYNLAVTSPAAGQISVAANYEGDYDSNSSAVAYYCDRTANALCEPTSSGLSVTLSAASSSYSGTITGLTTGHSYAVTVVVTDPDGAYGTPLRSTVISN